MNNYKIINIVSKEDAYDSLTFSLRIMNLARIDELERIGNYDIELDGKKMKIKDTNQWVDRMKELGVES